VIALSDPKAVPLRIRLSIAAALTAALMLAGCQAGKVQRPPCPAGQVCLEYGQKQEPLTLDPQTSNTIYEQAIISDLIVGLTTDAPDALPVPAAATSWEVSADGLVWTFHLRKGALWSDGVPVTADDFVFAYRRILNPRTASIYAYLVTIIKGGQPILDGKAGPETLGVRAIDPYTLEMTLEHPAPYLPELLKHQSFFPVPKHAVETWGDAWVQPGHYVSNGPFHLVSWRLGDKLQVAKSPTFWDAKNVCVDRVNYYPIPDLVSAERRIARGELDINNTFQSNRLARIRQAMPGVARTHVSLATSYLAFNTRDVAPLKDVRVRRALSEAIDRDFIVTKLLRAGQLPAYSFVPPGALNYVSGPRARWAGESFAQRQIEAKALLAAAGFTPQHPLKLDIKAANTSDTLLLSEAIQADWRAIGVEASITQNDGAIAFVAYRNRDFNVAPVSWFADFNDPMTFLGLLKSSTGAQNYGDYNSPVFDGLLDQADHEPDPGRRAAILARAEQTMLDDEGIAPIYFWVSRNLVNPKITGWTDNVEDFHRVRWLCAPKS
jgi:oligopeptide transport system substrate-binding protein